MRRAPGATPAPGRAESSTREQGRRTMKHTLDLQALHVQSFPVEAAPSLDAARNMAPSYIDMTMCHTNCTCPDTR